MTAPEPAPKKEIRVIRPPCATGKPVTAQTQGLDPPVRPLVFDHLPLLRELLGNKGVPGYYYLLVAVQGQVVAEAEGWKPVVTTSGRETLTIQGPEGACDARLYCWGERLPAANYQSSKRPIEYDKNIKEITGLGLPPTEVLTAAEKQTVETESTNEPVGEPSLVEVEKRARKKGAEKPQ